MLIVGPAVSAFAARKATRRPFGEVTSQNEVQGSLVNEVYDDQWEESKPPRKKQKRDTGPKTKSPRQPQQASGVLEVRDGSIEDSTKAIESDSESDSNSDNEPDTLIQPVAPAQRLSTFDLSRSKVLGETETEWTVRLHSKDVSIWHVPAFVARSEIYLESSNTRPVRYMGSIRRNQHSWICYPCQLSFTPRICPINPFDTSNSARTEPIRYKECSCRAHYHLVRQPDEDATAGIAEIWTHLEWETALRFIA